MDRRKRYSKFRLLPEYDQLVADHAVFHKQAALIVSKANEGEVVSPHDLTHPDSPYAIASRNVVAAIFGIKRKVGNLPLDPAVSPSLHGPEAHEKTPEFIKISSASPGIMHILVESADHTAEEISTIIKAYTDKPLSPALLSIIRESLLISSSRMFMEILDKTKERMKP